VTGGGGVKLEVQWWVVVQGVVWGDVLGEVERRKTSEVRVVVEGGFWLSVLFWILSPTIFFSFSFSPYSTLSLLLVAGWVFSFSFFPSLLLLVMSFFFLSPFFPFLSSFSSALVLGLLRLSVYRSSVSVTVLSLPEWVACCVSCFQSVAKCVQKCQPFIAPPR